MKRLALIALLLPLAVDCLLNALLGGSLRHTLSGEAWRQRDHKYWGWTHQFIDALFWRQDQHCKSQHDREAQHGSVWRAWSHAFNTTH